MSTQQILGVVGGVVGAFFGYPQLGFVVGSLIGGLLTPGEKTEGPRIDDQKVTVSTYGAGIPTLYGNGRMGGNVIWSTDKIEQATTTEAGKGGGAENTTYRYFVSMLVGLCKSPPPGVPVSIRKLFVDGKLQWDVSSGIPVGSALASAENPYAAIALLPGYEDELPVAQIEQVEGVGNVPAYRGICKFFIFGLETPGGRVPQVSVELCMGAGDTTEVMEMFTAIEAYGGLVNGEGAISFEHVVGTPAKLSLYQGGVGYNQFQKTVPLLSGFLTYLARPVIGSSPPMALVPRQVNSTDSFAVDIVDLEAGTVRTIYQTELLPSVDAKGGAAFDPINEKFALILAAGAPNQTPWIIDTELLQVCDALTGNGGPLAFYDNILYAVEESGGQFRLVKIDGDTGAILSKVIGPTFLVGPDAARSAIQADENGVYVYAAHGNSPITADIYKVGTAWDLVVANIDGAIGSTSSSVNTSFYVDDRHAVVGPAATTRAYSFVKLHVIEPVVANVQDIFEDQFLRAGLTEDQFDLTDVTETVWGYSLTNPASARSNIGPLMTAYNLYATEEDGKLKVKKLGGKTSVATIAYDELGASEAASDPGEPMPLVRAQDADLPRSVAVSYLNPDFDYQTGTEKATRQTFDSQSDQTVEMPISTTGAHAATVAQAILYDAHNERNKRNFSVSRKFAFLSAGDVVTVEYPRGTLGDVRLTKVTDTGVLIEAECVPYDSAIYTQIGVGSTGYVGQSVAALPSPQQLQLIDGPILQDADNNAGVYAAMEPFGDSAPGAELFMGDDDTDLQSRGVVNNAATIGRAEGALGAWTANIMDETNTVIVDVDYGELASTTRALIDTTTVNAFALGDNGRWEYGQFMTATSLGGGRYMLSSLVRGARGTERFRGTHAVGDRFVILSLAGMLHPSLDAGAIGSTKSYRAVTKGRSLNSASSQRYASTAESLKPFSPWDARWSKAASNDITMTWQRRSRLSSNPLMGIVPLGEATESYVVELYTSSALTTLAGTFTSTTNSLTVTSAQQTAIGLTPGATPFRRIYQVSDVLGNGAPLEAIT